MKLLFYGESPLNPTGFGQVNKHLLRACSRVADEITVVATTHYHETYDREEFPYEIIGCDPNIPHDFTGQKNLENIHAQLDAKNWDVFFIQGDMGASTEIQQKAAQIAQSDSSKHTIFYMPIDGDISLGFAFNPLAWCSAPVVYTNHAKSVVAKYAPDIAEKTSVIWLGCETDVFYPLSAEEKRAARLQFFGEAYLDRFIVININRNQVRKDLARCMAAFHLFYQDHPDCSLYMHSVQNDAGGSLPIQALLSGASVNTNEIVFSSLDLANPWPRHELNRVLNACDAYITTAYGEGWGLGLTEAMCAGIPVMAPYNTANIDILGKCVGWDFEYERGWGIKTGGDLDHTTFIYQNGGGPVPHVHTDSFLTTLGYIYSNREEAECKAQIALEWCRKNTWEHREKNWEDLLWLIKKTE
jgi:glycosyltransferase involved in cell wall biosynthesis